MPRHLFHTWLVAPRIWLVAPHSWLVATLLAVPLALHAAPAVEALALMRDQAILRIDGQQRTLRVGDSHGGVRLVAADPRQALLEIDGQRRAIGLSERIAGSFAARDRRTVTINRTLNRQYRTPVEVNGRTLVALVDTGANVVALNSRHAATLGIDFRRTGAPGRTETASGVRPSWVVQLDSIAVEGLVARNVRAVVIEGDFPTTLLLGMSYLEHVELREANGVMTLTEK